MRAFLLGLRNVIVGLTAFAAVFVALTWVGTKLFGNDGVALPFVVLGLVAVWALWRLFADSGDDRPGDMKLAESVLPPTEAELAGTVFLVDPENQPLLDRTGPGSLRLPRVRWVVAVVVFGLALWPWLVWALGKRPEDNSLILLILSFFTIPVLLFWIPGLARTTRRRYRLQRQGEVVKGVLQCLSARFALAGGDDLPEYKLTLGYAFHAPDHQLIKGVIRRSASHDNQPFKYSDQLFQHQFEGYDDGEYDYSRWPKPGGRVTAAILYVRPSLFQLL